MAVTQYIGARYVPIIFQNPDDNSNNWKAGVAYEPLTIVSYAGGSYTSKTAVPSSVGNPTDNPSYWVAIGLYSGQTAINTNSINQIRYTIASHSEAGNTCTEHRDEGDIVWIAGVLYQCTAEVNVNDTYTEGINITQIYDMAAVISTLSSGLTQAQSDIIDIGDDITDIQNDILALQNELSDPYTITIGDSYAEGYDPDGNNDGWPVYLANKGVTVLNLYAGGSAFSLATSDARSPLYQLQNATIPDGVTVRRIVACLGYNDFGANSATIISNIQGFISYCNTTFPEAQVYIGMCGYAWTHNADNKYGAQIVQTAIDYKKACADTNAIFMPQVLGVLLTSNGLSTADYKHPNATGNRTIADAIYAALHGVSFTTRGFYNGTLDKASVNFTCGLFMDYTLTDGVLTGYAVIQNAAMTNGDTEVNIYNGLDCNPAHFPCLPYICVQVNQLMHNSNRSHSNINRNYAIAPVFLKGAGYSSDGKAPLRIAILADDGGNYGRASQFEYGENDYYGNFCTSFV